MGSHLRTLAVGVALAILSAACGTSGGAEAPTTAPPAATTTVAATAPDPASTTSTSQTAPAPTTMATTTTSPATTAVDPPNWIGTRVLDVDNDGNAFPVPTPPELQDRRFRTADLLPPPTDGFVSTIGPVPDEVLARSTWHADCPISPEELAYLTLSFWGFDDRPHTGELVVNARFADEVAGVFEGLYNAGFPIEEMRVVTAEELDAPPTGDGNNTTSFVCRPTTGGTSWSQHAYGLAIDVNPFHNPYDRDGRVLPELATAYLHRDNVRPGMILEDDPAVVAFAAIGWGWGGDFRSLADYMHFSANDR